MKRLASLNVTFVAVCILFSLTGMFLASYFQNNFSTVKETRGRGIVSARPEETPSAGASAPGGTQADITEQQAGDLTELMGKLKSSPNDADALRQIGEIFISAQDWGRAEFFLSRAVLSRPKDIRPLYLLGISQYQQNKIEAATKSFEDLLQIKEEPTAMYNLAIIYKYNAGKKAEAEALLRKIIAFPGADANTVAKAKAEL